MADILDDILDDLENYTPHGLCGHKCNTCATIEKVKKLRTHLAIVKMLVAGDVTINSWDYGNDCELPKDMHWKAEQVLELIEQLRKQEEGK